MTTQYHVSAMSHANAMPMNASSSTTEFRRTIASVLLVRVLGVLMIAGGFATSAGAWEVWPFNKEDKPGKPDKVIVMWSDTVLTRSDRPPMRGFGGRLMFYEKDKEDSIKVEGTLVVYAFNETDHPEDNAKPDKKYVFLPEQLPGHYSKSKVGHSYSVWLPWDEVGGFQKEITLMVRFEPKEGPSIMGEQKRQLLPGKTPLASTAAQTPAPSSSIIQAAWSTSTINPTVKSNANEPACQMPPINNNALQPNNNLVQPNGNFVQPNNSSASVNNSFVQPVSYEAPVATAGMAMTPENVQPPRQLAMPPENAQPLRQMATATISIPSDMAVRTPMMLNPMPSRTASVGNWQQQPTCYQQPARMVNNQPAQASPSVPAQTAAVPLGTQPSIFSTSRPAISTNAMQTNVMGYQNSQQLQAGSAPDQSQTQGAILAQPNRDRGPWQQRPVISQCAPGSQSELNGSNGFPAN
jgi:hypothetical protein